MLSKKPEGSFFRVQLDSSGCGDFSYEFMIETEVEDEDMFVFSFPLPFSPFSTFGGLKERDKKFDPEERQIVGCHRCRVFEGVERINR